MKLSSTAKQCGRIPAGVYPWVAPGHESRPFAGHAGNANAIPAECGAGNARVRALNEGCHWPTRSWPSRQYARCPSSSSQTVSFHVFSI